MCLLAHVSVQTITRIERLTANAVKERQQPASARSADHIEQLVNLQRNNNKTLKLGRERRGQQTNNSRVDELTNNKQNNR